MGNMTLKLTLEELRLLAGLAADQLFRKQFIDPKMPGYRAKPEEMKLGKTLVAVLKPWLTSAANDGGCQSENRFHGSPISCSGAPGEPEADRRIGRAAAPTAGGGCMKLLYMGFAHKTTGIRHYSFQGQIPDGTRKGFFVSTDVALLTKHHIQIQEVPMMCLRLLESAAEAQPQLNFILTEADMLAT